MIVPTSWSVRPPSTAGNYREICKKRCHNETCSHPLTLEGVSLLARSRKDSQGHAGSTEFGLFGPRLFSEVCAFSEASVSLKQPVIDTLQIQYVSTYDGEGVISRATVAEQDLIKSSGPPLKSGRGGVGNRQSVE